METEPGTTAATDSSWRGPELLTLAAFLIVAALVLWLAADVFLLIFAGLLLANFLVFLSQMVSRFLPLSHGWSLAIVLLVLLLFGALVGGLLGIRIAAESDNLTGTLQDAWAQVKERASGYEWSRQLLSQPPTNQFANLQGDWLSRISGVFSTTLGVLSSCLLVLFISVFTAADPGLYRRGLVRLVPIDRRGQARQILDELSASLRWWFIGQLFSMTIVGLATAFGLWLLGIPFFMTLGVLAAVLTFIPNFGPIISAVPAVLLALTHGPLDALYVVLLYLGVQAVESNLLTPLVQQRNVDLPPVLNVGVQVVMGVLVGVLGLIVAAPLTVCGMILVQRLYVEGVLGDQLKSPS